MKTLRTIDPEEVAAGWRFCAQCLDCDWVFKWLRYVETAETVGSDHAVTKKHRVAIREREP